MLLISIIISIRRRPFKQAYYNLHFRNYMKRYHLWLSFVRSAAGATSSFPSMGKPASVARSKSCKFRKEIGKINGAWFYHPPTKIFSTSWHIKWHPESFYDPIISKHDVSTRIQRAELVEDCMTNIYKEDGLLYVTKKVG